MDVNINAPMARAPVIRATIWPQIRRIVSPRIVICQSRHIVHQVSNHKTEILNDVNRQTNKNNNSNLRIIWKKIMAIIADATFAVAKRKLSYRNCTSCVYKCDDLLSYTENNTWVARRYGIYLRVFTSTSNEWDIECEHEKINSISPSVHVLFCLLYKQESAIP